VKYIYEDLAEKTIKWEPTSDKSKNSNPISSKGGLHSIETSIEMKDKFASVMRRLKDLETKEPVPVNQVSSTQSTSAGCTYCQVMNHVFKECHVFLAHQMLLEHMNEAVFLAHQMLLEHMNAAFARPNNNSYSQTYNPGWGNDLNF